MSLANMLRSCRCHSRSADICEIGFHASTPAEFSEAFAQALTLTPEETLAMRLRARKSSQRFSEEVFSTAWIMQLQRLVELSQSS